MDPEDSHTEWNKSETEREISSINVHIGNLEKKMVEMNLLAKQK